MSLPAFLAPLPLGTLSLQRAGAVTPRRERTSTAPLLCAGNKDKTHKKPFPIHPNHHAVRDVDPSTLEPAHPFGTGGVPDEVDWTGYDPVALQREVDEAVQALADAPPDEHDGPWALLVNADLIQWRNNLFEASLADGSGFSWDLDGVRLVRLSAVTARREILDHYPDVYTVECDSRPIVTGVRDDCPPCLISFVDTVEADRFADLLRAEVDDPVVVAKRPTNVVANMCDENGILIAVIPTKTLISPAMLGIKRKSAPAS